MKIKLIIGLLLIGLLTFLYLVKHEELELNSGITFEGNVSDDYEHVIVFPTFPGVSEDEIIIPTFEKVVFDNGELGYKVTLVGLNRFLTLEEMAKISYNVDFVEKNFHDWATSYLVKAEYSLCDLENQTMTLCIYVGGGMNSNDTKTKR